MAQSSHDAREDDGVPLHGLRGGPRGSQYGLVNVNIDFGAKRMPLMLTLLAGVGLFALNFERLGKVYAQALAHPGQSFAIAVLFGTAGAVLVVLWLSWRLVRWFYRKIRPEPLVGPIKRMPPALRVESHAVPVNSTTDATVLTGTDPSATKPAETFLPPAVVAAHGEAKPASPPSGEERNVVHSPTRAYEIVKLIGSTGLCKFYLVREAGTTRDLVLKVAQAAEHNGVLDREAALLRDLKDASDRIEAEYASKNPGQHKLNYQFCFPDLVESFVSEAQGGRRVTVVRFDGIEDFSKLSALGHIAARERTRIDPKTSAWIMGKLLKIIAFAHDQGVGIGNLDGDNIMIDRAEHFVLVFDWTDARRYEPVIPQETAAAEIADAARALISTLGGDPATGTLPASEQLEDERYVYILRRMVSGRESDAFRLHGEFYGLIRELWPRRGFHPYTAYPLT